VLIGLPFEAPSTRAIEPPKTPEPKPEAKIDPSEPVPGAPAPTDTQNSTATSAPATPARVPARVVPFGGTDIAKADGLRPATPGATIGTPPPVPRRAAARGAPRPGSMLVPDIFKPPPPRSDKRGVGKIGGEEKERKEEEKKGDIPDQRKAVKAEAKDEEEEPTVVVEETKGVVGVEPKVELEDPSPAPTSQVERVAPDTATPNTPINSSPPLPESILEPGTEASLTTATEITPTDRASIVSASSASVYTKDTKDAPPSIPDVSTTEEVLPDDGQWVGNARWEDRAWNELVRIREEMFWARVGSGIIGGAKVN
jgi:hypothetical protein